ncbi:hypothetical protein SAMN05444358_10539 [Ruegeria halocynthiae]|uniref:Lysylphosphatidylglycerol synthase TM region n=1 Tax=Ruegeria halocynthiae TaxID=985054 RepID=A0A1H3B4Y2_9RHOB|nr:hypothetical protein [Ruegeria halocynthiae]SDX36454.1 hypothetical protein SAMN05444358_10539 [Ruegeria halocynthiae]
MKINNALITRFWVLLVIGFVTYILIKEPETLHRSISRLEWSTALPAIALIVVGKILMVALVHFSLKGYGENRSALFCWRAYSLADIAKYLPGGIWGIAGRLAIYKHNNIDLRKGSKILLSETYILILLFGLTGVLSLSLTLRIDWVFQALLTLGLIASIASLKICLPNGCWANRVGAFLVAAVGCVFFGLSFAIIALPVASNWLWSAGQFNLAFAVGQLAIFAPSGIGVREIVVGMLLPENSDLSVRHIVEITVTHRFLWLIADLALVLPLLVMPKDLIGKN